jgi:DNA-binding HxlR family transcriptional regulator
MSAASESDSVPNLRELVNHAHVVEVVDALIPGPKTFADLCSQVRAGRRELAAALRVVGARGIVTKTGNGTWDTQPCADAVYRLMPLGRQVVEVLSQFSVWAAMCGDDRLPVPPAPPGKRRRTSE